jgi:hypothetical protein
LLKALLTRIVRVHSAKLVRIMGISREQVCSATIIYEASTMEYMEVCA